MQFVQNRYANRHGGTKMLSVVGKLVALVDSSKLASASKGNAVSAAPIRSLLITVCRQPQVCKCFSFRRKRDTRAKDTVGKRYRRHATLLAYRDAARPRPKQVIIQLRRGERLLEPVKVSG